MNTPCFSYDMAILNETLHQLNDASSKRNYKVHYAVKANYNPQILDAIMLNGLGADCVSGREIAWALEAGFNSDKVVFAGVGKSDEEIAYAISNDIAMIHCEGLQEAITVNEIAKSQGKIVNIALRLNPNVNANTHAKITTGLSENKFGFSVIELNKLILMKDQLTNLNIQGLHFHIGSQIRDLNIFKSLCEKVNDYIRFFELNFNTLSYLNLGGGLGVNYDNPDAELIPDFEAYFATFEANLLEKNIEVHFELGRSVVAQCGKLYTKVLYVKESETKKFAVIDAGMTELLRPALYDAYHHIDFNGIAFKSDVQKYDVVGPICESSDCLGKDVQLPELRRGDILVIRSCGAYGESMSLNYNGRIKQAAVYC
ncbi:diaminopimelate decarboxylase [Putridiphycobacter roseus]|uniref:Diaminopimelate decarboxylase n=1 Tax=Putridiphycobacter roseus TaxID=2219161 RepID=A0A2W1N4B7_9FLAO|nr:diaminopimelate decarboxylase [Putridiphycobacter roseus]PZE17911.1 diaminopimelate decarboxylase [Putridiphycobacter roseus]